MANTKKAKETTAKERLERLETEYDEVAERLSRLNKSLFKDTEKERKAFLKKVGQEQYALLVEQQEFMTAYRDTLAKRIQLFKFEHKGEL